MHKFKVTKIHSNGKQETYIRFAADICHVEEMERTHSAAFDFLVVEAI